MLGLQKRMLSGPCIVEMQNCLFVHSFIEEKLPKSFENFFKNLVMFTLKPQVPEAMNVYTYLALKMYFKI